MAGKISNTDLRVQFVYLLGLLFSFALKNGIRVIITDHYRTAEQQNRLFKEGKSTKDGYTNLSRHQWWLAVDLAVVDENDKSRFEDLAAYHKLGEYWESIGGIWGGRWQNPYDIYHFEIDLKWFDKWSELWGNIKNSLSRLPFSFLR